MYFLTGSGYESVGWLDSVCGWIGKVAAASIFLNLWNMEFKKFNPGQRLSFSYYICVCIHRIYIRVCVCVSQCVCVCVCVCITYIYIVGSNRSWSSYPPSDSVIRFPVDTRSLMTCGTSRLVRSLLTCGTRCQETAGRGDPRRVFTGRVRVREEQVAQFEWVERTESRRS